MNTAWTGGTHTGHMGFQRTSKTFKVPGEAFKTVASNKLVAVENEFLAATIKKFKEVGAAQLASWQQEIVGKKPKGTAKRKDGTFKDEAPVLVCDSPEGTEASKFTGTQRHPTGSKCGFSYAWEKKADTLYYVDEPRCERSATKSVKNVLEHAANVFGLRIQAASGGPSTISGDFKINEAGNIEGVFTIKRKESDCSCEIYMGIIMGWRYNKPLYKFPTRYQNVIIEGVNQGDNHSIAWMKDNFK